MFALEESRAMRPADAMLTLARAVDGVAALADASAEVRAQAACDALREADRLIAAAIRVLGSGNGVAAATGLPAEMLLVLQARRTHRDARMLLLAAEQLRAMPYLAAAFSNGVVSWSQVRGIVSAAARVPARAREELDALVRDHAEDLVDAEPDRLVALIDARVERARQAEMVAKEDRQTTNSFLAIQARIDGGAAFYGEADPVSAATLIEALDHASPAPEHPDDEDATPRGRQRFEGLLRLAESYLAGSSEMQLRPRPRVLLTVDLAALEDERDSTRLLWGLRGRLPSLSNVTAQTLLCDASITPVLFKDGRPLAVGDERNVFSDKVRRGILARDGGCRFPGCTAPAAWTDVHHIVWGIGNSVDDGMLLCRRCHNRVHHRNWQVTMRRDGTATFQKAHRAYTSHPRGSPPRH